MPSRPPLFRPAGTASPEAREKAYERERGSARQRGYTARWDKASKLYLAQHPLCLGCEADDIVAVAVLVDHIVPHKGDDALFWDQSNWQACCRWHHDVVKQQLEARGAGPADLRLDSRAAVSLARSLRGGRGV